MNKEKLLMVADAIEAETIAKFEMENYLELDETAPCGTAACVAGFTCLLFSEIPPKIEDESYAGDDVDEIHENARDFLGLTDEQANELFLATSAGTSEEWGPTNIDRNYREKVPGALRKMAETGDIHWGRALDLPTQTEPSHEIYQGDIF